MRSAAVTNTTRVEAVVVEEVVGARVKRRVGWELGCCAMCSAAALRDIKSVLCW